VHLVIEPLALVGIAVDELDERELAVAQRHSPKSAGNSIYADAVDGGMTARG
jgi:hypothetical protein